MPESAKNQSPEPDPPIEPESHEIVLSRRDFDRVLDLIENPPEPSEKLKELARRCNEQAG